MSRYAPLRLIGLLALILALTPISAMALESDQFTLPPKPLADIGPEFDAHVSDELDSAIRIVNDKLIDLRNRLDETTSDYWKKYFRKEIEKASQPQELVKALRGLTGSGIPSCTIERWVVDHDFEAQPEKYEIGYGDSVFGASAIFKPLLIVALAPSIRVYGTDMGTDKIGHIFQQGYEYFKVYDDQLEHEKSREKALAAAVKSGVGKEKSVYGKWWTGVVSNADLAANYAGLKFYINLTEPVKIGEKTWPALTVVRDGLWVRNPAAHHLMRPFISEHYSEAFNPSMYDSSVRNSVRSALKSRGQAWVEFHKTTREAEVLRLKRVTTWFGEDYGHEGGDDLVTIVNGYFDLDPSRDDDADGGRTLAVEPKHDATGSN